MIFSTYINANLATDAIPSACASMFWLGSDRQVGKEFALVRS